MRRMALNIGSQFGAMRVPMYVSMTRMVMKTDMIQYMVDNANIIVVTARSHFRDRLRSPLVLFYCLRKKLASREIVEIPYTMT
jgi:hypothetical protein